MVLWLTLSLLTCASFLWRLTVVQEDAALIMSSSLEKSTHSPLDSPLHRADQSLAEPWDIVDQYMSWHAQEALHQEIQGGVHTNRSFAIAFYSCPLQIGNRFHHFLNSFLWSIVTNRTLLWHYWDRKTCRKYGSNYDGRICEAANRVEDCDVHLQRQDWMASYHDWSSREPNDQYKKVKKLSHWATHGQHSDSGRGFHEYNQSTRVLNDQLGIDARYEQWPVVVFPQMLDQSHELNRETTRHHLLHTQWARETAKVLFRYGPDYLYGLLFHSAFGGLTPELMNKTKAAVIHNQNFHHKKKKSTVSDDKKDLGSSNCSIAVHSRHTFATTIGDDVEEEIRCIEALWKEAANNHTECDLYLLSDRPRTIRELVEWCQKQVPKHSINGGFPCRRVVFAKVTTGLSFVMEHGPYAGAGFLQDLTIARSSALSSIGIVGSKRSSTNLLVEWMEYDRLVDYNDKNGRHQWKERPPRELPRCMINRIGS